MTWYAAVLAIQAVQATQDAQAAQAAQSAMLQFAAIVTPLFIACFLGIVAVYTRLTKIETKLEPVYQQWLNRKIKGE